MRIFDIGLIRIDADLVALKPTGDFLPFATQSWHGGTGTALHNDHPAPSGIGLPALVNQGLFMGGFPDIAGIPKSEDRRPGQSASMQAGRQ